MDLVDFSRIPDGIYKWVMHYIDHHSGFCHVACLPNKEAVTCGNALFPILATAVISSWCVLHDTLSQREGCKPKVHNI